MQRQLGISEKLKLVFNIDSIMMYNLFFLENAFQYQNIISVLTIFADAVLYSMDQVNSDDVRSTDTFFTVVLIFIHSSSI